MPLSFIFNLIFAFTTLSVFAGELALQELEFARGLAPSQEFRDSMTISHQLISIAQPEVVEVKQGCKALLGTVKIDCFGILLKGVTIDNDTQPVSIGNVLIFPAATERSEAERLMNEVVHPFANQQPEKRRIRLSNLRYSNTPFELSKLTKNPDDNLPVILGGIAIDEDFFRSHSSPFYPIVKIGLQQEL